MYTQCKHYFTHRTDPKSCSASGAAGPATGSQPHGLDHGKGVKPGGLVPFLAQRKPKPPQRQGVPWQITACSLHHDSQSHISRVQGRQHLQYGTGILPFELPVLRLIPTMMIPALTGLIPKQWISYCRFRLSSTLSVVAFSMGINQSHLLSGTGSGNMSTHISMVASGKLLGR